MTEMQALIGRIQLKSLDNQIKKKFNSEFIFKWIKGLL